MAELFVRTTNLARNCARIHKPLAHTTGDFISDRIAAKKLTTRAADTTSPEPEAEAETTKSDLEMPHISLPASSSTTTTLPGPDTTPDPIKAERKTVRTPAETKSRHEDSPDIPESSSHKSKKANFF